ncbi:MAG: hypothetical protein IJQ22_05850 [Bacteroidales bacterium]|nr:hypothetical protein [Bacteroidales bacterium]
MKIFYILLSIIIASASSAQNVIHLGRSHNPSNYPIPDEYKIPYALVPDPFLDNLKDDSLSVFVTHPTLVLNGLIVRDSCIIDKFRNTYKSDSIKVWHLSYKKASKRKIPCTKDGAVIIKTRRGYFIEL